MNFSWIYEIEDYEKHLESVFREYDDLLELLKICRENEGVDAFLEINKTFLKTNIKPLEKPFNDLKKIYVFQHRNEPVKKLARKMMVEERTIYQWLQEFGVKRGISSRDEKTKDLFES